MSDESVAWWFTVSAVGLGAIAAILGVFAWYFTDRASDSTKRELARFQSESKTATASAEARSAEANAKAAEAKEGTATALADAAAANERAAKLEPEAGEQRQRAAKAEEKAIRAEAIAAGLERKIEPRRIGSVSATTLINALRGAVPKGAVSIHCVMGDTEGAAFAEQLENLLKAGGWPRSADGVSHGAYTGGNPTGWGLMVNSVASPPPHAIALRQAFVAAGFNIGFVQKPTEVPAGAVRMIVGVKQ